MLNWPVKMAFNKRVGNKHDPGVLPVVNLAQILLYLPIEDILTLKTLIPLTDLCRLVLVRLLSSPDQGQFPIRFSENLSCVLSKPQLQEVRVNPNTILIFCAELKRVCESYSVGIKPIKAVSASSNDGLNQDIDNTVDRNRDTWWSSNPGPYQDKEDWLLYDLGSVMFVDRIGIAAYKSNFPGYPIFGFQSIRIQLGMTSDSFYYQTEIQSGSPDDDLQYFDIKKSGAKLSARFVKIWLRGCNTKCFDGFWYFAIESVRVWGWHNFPSPIDKVLRGARSSRNELLSWSNSLMQCIRSIDF